MKLQILCRGQYMSIWTAHIWVKCDHITRAQFRYRLLFLQRPQFLLYPIDKSLALLSQLRFTSLQRQSSRRRYRMQLKCPEASWFNRATCPAVETSLYIVALDFRCRGPKGTWLEQKTSEWWKKSSILGPADDLQVAWNGTGLWRGSYEGRVFEFRFLISDRQLELRGILEILVAGSTKYNSIRISRRTCQVEMNGASIAGRPSLVELYFHPWDFMILVMSRDGQILSL